MLERWINRLLNSLKSTCHYHRTSGTRWQQRQNPFLVPSIQSSLMNGLPWLQWSLKKNASFTLNRSCKLIHTPSLLFNWLNSLKPNWKRLWQMYLKRIKKLYNCMNATVNNDWVEYLEPSEQVKLGRRWQWQAPNDHPRLPQIFSPETASLIPSKTFCWSALARRISPWIPRAPLSPLPAMQWKLLKNCAILSLASN